MISIGHTCATANMLKYFGFRERSYPFDWLITDLNGIISAFENKFKHFMDKEFFKDVMPGGIIKELLPGRMEHCLYKFFSIHDFTVKITNPKINRQFVDVQAKFDRRIKRLISEIKSGRLVYLIRWNNCLEASQNVTKETYIQLRNFLKKEYPQSNVIIIAVDQEEAYLKDWDLQDIKNYYMPYHPESSNAHHLWIPILYEHGLIK